MISTTHTRGGARTGYGAPRLLHTRNDLPADVRAQTVRLLEQQLVDCIDLQTQCRQAHWNVKGPNFIALHELFNDINVSVEGYVDLLGERVVQLGGIAEGTARVVAARSQLPEYPLNIVTGEEHVTALAGALAQFGSSARKGIDEMEESGDKESADILTEISRGTDKWLWFVEAHQQGGRAETSSATARSK